MGCKEKNTSKLCDCTLQLKRTLTRPIHSFHFFGHVKHIILPHIWYNRRYTLWCWVHKKLRFRFFYYAPFLRSLSPYTCRAISNLCTCNTYKKHIQLSNSGRVAPYAWYIGAEPLIILHFRIQISHPLVTAMLILNSSCFSKLNLPFVARIHNFFNQVYVEFSVYPGDCVLSFY